MPGRWVPDTGVGRFAGRVGFLEGLRGLDRVADVGVVAFVVVGIIVVAVVARQAVVVAVIVAVIVVAVGGEHDVAVAVDGNVALVEHAGLSLDDAFVVAAVVAMGPG